MAGLFTSAHSASSNSYFLLITYTLSFTIIPSLIEVWKGSGNGKREKKVRLTIRQKKLEIIYKPEKGMSVSAVMAEYNISKSYRFSGLFP